MTENFPEMLTLLNNFSGKPKEGNNNFLTLSTDIPKCGLNGPSALYYISDYEKLSSNFQQFFEPNNLELLFKKSKNIPANLEMFFIIFSENRRATL